MTDIPESMKRVIDFNFDNEEGEYIMTHENIEPSADARAVAKALRDQFLALVKEGFTEHQALTVIGQMLASGPH